MCLFTFLFLLLALDEAAARIFTMFPGIEGGVMGSDRWRHQSFMLLFLWRAANDECIIGRRSIQSQNSKLDCMYMHVTIFKLPQSR